MGRWIDLTASHCAEGDDEHGGLELTVPDIAAHLEERGGFAVIVPDEPVRCLTMEETLAAIKRSRGAMVRSTTR